MMTPSRSIALSALVALAVSVTACTVGPDYQGPPRILPAAAGFHRAADVATAPGALNNRWWLSLHDAELDRLETLALSANPDLDAAVARLRQSRAGLREQRADQLPTTGAYASYLRASSGGSGVLGSLTGNAAGASSGQTAGGGSSDLGFYEAGFDATWELDLFGGQRRAVESAAATAQNKEAALADAQVSLTAEIAQSYVSLRDLQARFGLAQRSAGLDGRLVDYARTRETGGTASALEVTRLTTQFENSRADLVPLRAQMADQLDRIAMLAGQLPGSLDTQLEQPSALPLPPETVAIGDPASLLRRRPDVRAAERQIASQNAVIGERVADLFPKVTLLGNLDFGSTDVGQLFTDGSFSAVGAPMLQWKPFDFGRTKARIHQAQAARDEAIADYRGTVLKALADAETAMARFGIQRDNVASLQRAKSSADSAAALTRRRYAGGTATVIDTLDTERQRLQAEQALSESEADLTQDFIGLQKSLGLGWGRPPPQRGI